MEAPPLGLSMTTAGIIVFAVSGIVILSMPAIFVWMLWHTHRERKRWRTEALQKMGGETVKKKKPEEEGKEEAEEPVRGRQRHRQKKSNQRPRQPRKSNNASSGEEHNTYVKRATPQRNSFH